MISGISGVGHMTGVLAVQPYKGAKQNMRRRRLSPVCSPRRKSAQSIRGAGRVRVHR